MTNKDKARLLRSAASALDHGRIATASAKLAKVLPNRITLDSEELATVLAALRAWQSVIVDNWGMIPNQEHFRDHAPLTCDEIDILCERLNR